MKTILAIILILMSSQVMGHNQCTNEVETPKAMIGIVDMPSTSGKFGVSLTIRCWEGDLSVFFFFHSTMNKKAMVNINIDDDYDVSCEMDGAANNHRSHFFPKVCDGVKREDFIQQVKFGKVLRLRTTKWGGDVADYTIILDKSGYMAQIDQILENCKRD